MTWYMKNKTIEFFMTFLGKNDWKWFFYVTNLLFCKFWTLPFCENAVFTLIKAFTIIINNVRQKKFAFQFSHNLWTAPWNLKLISYQNYIKEPFSIIFTKKSHEKLDSYVYHIPRHFWTLPSTDFSKLWMGLSQTPLVSPFISKKLQNSSKL